MIDPQKLADNLQTLTGIPFGVKGRIIESDTTYSAEQEALLSRVCEASGLLVRQKLARRVSGGDDIFADVEIVSVTDDQLAAIGDLMAGEAARVAELEQLKGLLEAKTGVEFRFSDDHKILLTGDPLSRKEGNPAEHQAALSRINGLGRAGAIRSKYIMNGNGMEIGVFSINGRSLALQPDSPTRLPEQSAPTEEMNVPPGRSAVDRLTSPSQIDRPGVPGRPTGWERGN